MSGQRLSQTTAYSCVDGSLAGVQSLCRHGLPHQLGGRWPSYKPGPPTHTGLPGIFAAAHCVRRSCRALATWVPLEPVGWCW